jgi:ArsR family transcriptional regulator
MERLSSRIGVNVKHVDDLSIPQEIADSLCSCGGIEGIVKQMPRDEELEELRDWCQACADTARLKILFLLMVRPLCVCVIKAIVEIADSRLSYHLNILKKAGLIEGEQQGNYIIYRITPDARSFIEREYKKIRRAHPEKG